MNYIPLFRNRDFGMLFSDSIQYVIQNARSLYIPLLMYAAPVIAIGGIISGFFTQDIMSAYTEGFQEVLSGGSFADVFMDMAENQPNSPGTMAMVWLASLVSVVGNILMAGLVYQHMIAYSQNPEDVEDQEQLRADAFGFFGKLLWTTIVLGFFIFLFVFAYAILVGLTAALTPILGVLIGLGGMVFMVYLGVPLAMLYVVVMYEGIKPLDGMRRCFALIKGHWWKFFGVLFVMYIAVGMVSAVVSIPATLLSGIGTVTMVIGQVAVAAVTVVLNAPIMVASGMQYFSTSNVVGDDQYIGDVIDEIGGNQEDAGSW